MLMSPAPPPTQQRDSRIHMPSYTSMDTSHNYYHDPWVFHSKLCWRHASRQALQDLSMGLVATQVLTSQSKPCLLDADGLPAAVEQRAVAGQKAVQQSPQVTSLSPGQGHACRVPGHPGCQRRC